MKEIETTLRPLASAEDRFQRNLVSVIIPAYNPGALLVDLVDKLLGLGFTSIIVVDDGSETSSLPIFDSLAERAGCVVLRHAVNCGKGRALKTAFNHCFLTLADSVGVI